MKPLEIVNVALSIILTIGVVSNALKINDTRSDLMRYHFETWEAHLLNQHGINVKENK